MTVPPNGNYRHLLLAAAASAGVLAGCHDDRHGPAGPPQSAQALDTAQALKIAQQASETTSPFTVDDGAVRFTDTSETSQPIMVNAM